MRAQRRTTCMLSILLFTTVVAEAQLAQPTIAASNIEWGWFDLTMTGASVTPANTHWLITLDDVTVFDTWRRLGPDCEGPFFEMRIPNEFVADTRDLTSKRIVGCAPGRSYAARVRYNDGAQWSPFSETINFTTPPEPVRTDDTVNVLVWGHSLAGFGSECSVNGDITYGDGGDGFTVLYDNPSFTHALQTELRRSTGRTVTIINGAISGSRQSRWMRSGIGADTAVDHEPDESYQYIIRHYLPGGQFADAQSYPIAVFFFGQNDARSGWCDAPTYSSSQFADDAATIIDRLTSQGVSVVYNSIHYSTSIDCVTGYWGGASVDRQQRYLRAWDSLMSVLVPQNNRLVRGPDLFALFQNDTARFHLPDGAHANLSEGTAAIVEALAPPIATAVNRATGVALEVRSTAMPTLSIVRSTSGFEAHLTVAARDNRRTTLEAFNVVGERVVTLLDRVIEPGVHSIPLESSSLADGPYLLVMRTGETAVVRRFDVVR